MMQTVTNRQRIENEAVDLNRSSPAWSMEKLNELTGKNATKSKDLRDLVIQYNGNKVAYGSAFSSIFGAALRYRFEQVNQLSIVNEYRCLTFNFISINLNSIIS